MEVIYHCCAVRWRDGRVNSINYIINSVFTLGPDCFSNTDQAKASMEEIKKLLASSIEEDSGVKCLPDEVIIISFTKL
jgi:hypothetical protein